jgi:POLO box duplicated region
VTRFLYGPTERFLVFALSDGTLHVHFQDSSILSLTPTHDRLIFHSPKKPGRYSIKYNSDSLSEMETRIEVECHSAAKRWKMAKDIVLGLLNNGPSNFVAAEESPFKKA